LAESIQLVFATQARGYDDYANNISEIYLVDWL
jgi:hypothetical protein